MRKQQVVGIGEWRCSNIESETITTFSLSTCVGVTVYCPYRKVSGMLHILLPTPRKEEEAEKQPGRFATTGIPLLIREMTEIYGCRKSSLEVRLYGGASSGKRHEIFEVGSRNLEQAQAELRKLNLVPKIAEVGGSISRTLEMNVKTGIVHMRTLPLSS
ncbi:chemotaxis protein CheD [Paenibacillus rhizovicinus]|uniref:Probable chemoreceptor glutamine deamidase CheD n=1 Tax=Paenibacillus rhizovicinus TaxID=2704463 RepID=A0A6C0P8P5_9BACL|nr:chemotaxis protein CheD [Paenibacillus rhizovicinus]QHW34003.1 chemotaxis protein CheD [Paenibacillus rhizovicinus]